MAVGGFNGTDPAPTLEQFQQLVAASRIHWFVGGGRPGRPRGVDGHRRQRRRRPDRRVGPATFTPTTVDGTTVYDLTGTAS